MRSRRALRILARDAVDAASPATNTIDWLTCLVHLRSPALIIYSLNPVSAAYRISQIAFSFLSTRSPLCIVSLELQY